MSRDLINHMLKRSADLLKEGSTIVEWFDPSNKDHMAAYKVLSETKSWPAGVVPAGVSLIPGWERGIDRKVSEQLDDEFTAAGEAEGGRHFGEELVKHLQNMKNTYGDLEPEEEKLLADTKKRLGMEESNETAAPHIQDGEWVSKEKNGLSIRIVDSSDDILTAQAPDGTRFAITLQGLLKDYDHKVAEGKEGDSSKSRHLYDPKNKKNFCGQSGPVAETFKGVTCSKCLEIFKTLSEEEKQKVMSEGKVPSDKDDDEQKIVQKLTESIVNEDRPGEDLEDDPSDVAGEKKPEDSKDISPEDLNSDDVGDGEDAKEADFDKVYLGKNDTTHFYVVAKKGDAGEVEDLMVTDQEGKELFTASANDLDPHDVASFILAAVNDDQVKVAELEREVVLQYLVPQEEEELDSGEDEEPEGEEVPPEMEEQPKETPKAEDQEQVDAVPRESRAVRKNSLNEATTWHDLGWTDLDADDVPDLTGWEVQSPDGEVYQVTDWDEKSITIRGASDEDVVLRVGDDFVYRRSGRWKLLDPSTGRPVQMDKGGPKEAHESKQLSETMMVKDGKGNSFSVQLVDEGSKDVVVQINNREFRFKPDFAALYEQDQGKLTEQGLQDLAMETISHLEPTEYAEVVGGGVQKEGKVPSDKDDDEQKIVQKLTEYGHGRSDLSCPRQHVSDEIRRDMNSDYIDSKQLEAGTKEEMEHTKDPNEARKIAMDHLKEDPEYYIKLNRAGLMKKTNENEFSDMTAVDKSVFQVDFELENGEKKRTRVIAFDMEDAARMVKKGKGVKSVIQATPFKSSESKSDERTDMKTGSKIHESWQSQMKKVNERQWKYKVDLSFLAPYTSGDEEADDSKVPELGRKAAEILRAAVKTMDPEAASDVESMASEFEDAVSVEDFDSTLNELYRIGDEYSIWFHAMEDFPGAQETPEKSEEPPVESKTNEGTGSEYHDKLFAFLDHPWQEDTEIEVVRLIGEYRNDFKVAKPEQIQDYLKRLVSQNNLMGNQGLSDDFSRQLQDLMGGSSEEGAGEEAPAEGSPAPTEEKKESQNESKKVNETSEDDVERFEEIIEEIGQLVDEAYEIVRASGNRSEAERAKSYWRGHIQGALGEGHSEYLGGSMHTMEDSLKALQEGDVEDSEDEDFDDEDFEEDEDEPVESKNESRRAVRTARNLLGLKESKKEDDAVKVGDLVQIVDRSSFRVEVEEATVKAIDENLGVEITGSTIPDKQKWFDPKYWNVFKV